MSDRDEHAEIARRAYIAGAQAVASRPLATPADVAHGFDAWWHGVKQERRPGDAQTPGAAEIESMLVDALETELEDYQSADASWKAVRAACEGLQKRDTEIAMLRAELARVRG